jgi:signal transduction histidine kinase/CheY-like chemotaxis protein
MSDLESARPSAKQRPVRWFRGLRVRLMIFVLVALFPAIAVLISQGAENRRRATNEAEAQTLQLARMAAQAHERRIEGARQLLVALSSMPAIRSGDRDDCTALVRALVREYQGLYTEIGWADRSGDVRCHAMEGPSAISIGDRAYFQRTLATNRFAVGDLNFGKLSGLPIMAFGYPLHDATGAVSGVLFVNLDLRVMTRSVTDPSGTPGATLSILDRSGAVVARSVDAAAYFGKRATADQLRRIISDGDTVRTFEGPDGAIRTYGIATIRDEVGDPTFFVTYGVPQTQLLADISSRLRGEVLTLALMCIGMALAAWLASEWLVRRPVSRLLTTTAALASGRLDARVEQVGSTREFEVLARALNDMAQRLSDRDVYLRQGQRLEAVGQLAGGIAHDFNNLLTIILGYCCSLEEQLGPESPLVGEVIELRRGAERAADLTRQLLAFSRRQLLVAKPLQLNDSIEQMRTLLQRTIGPDYLLDIVLDPKLGIVRADVAQIEQVILNLVINARDAMPHGGPIRIATKNRVVDEPAHPDTPTGRAGAFVEISVADSGMGMDAETRARIFEPFFTTKGPRGTGLGLATVYGIVKQSDGAVVCESSPGAGARFVILLPVTSERMEQPAKVEEAPVRGSETLMVVDDEQPIQSLIAASLVRDGYVIQPFGSGDSALQWFTSGQSVGGVIVDMRMPGMSGLTLARELRARDPHLPIMLISGDSAPDLSKDEFGEALPFLQKPFTPRDLRQAVRALLDSAKRADAAA